MTVVDWDVFKFEIKINDVEYKQTIGDDLRIDRSILDDEFCEQSTKFAYYSTLHELARDKEARLKRELELFYANVDAEKRAGAIQAQAANPKFKYTEKMCENEVKTDERYQKKQLEYLDAKKLSGILGVAREAFAQRKEMLISVGANARSGVTSARVLSEQAKHITNTTKETKQNRRTPIR